jgi:putative DNA methylase
MSDAARPVKRKLIEVALPLSEISKASRADKNRKVGTIKNVHKWFAPMPTPALRALIFAALVEDPGEENARQDLLNLVKDLVPEDGGPPKQQVLDRAARKIRAENPILPTVVDPFVGGGSTLVEAQRLGLPVFGSDLNPVPALISRTLAQLLPPLARIEPVTATSRLSDQPYDGFIDDLRHYGQLVQEAAEKRLDFLYPKPSTGEPVAWLWARTAPCPNPACSLTVPLFGSPWLSKQKGREASLEAVPDGGTVRLVVHRKKGSPAKATKTAGRANFKCPGCQTDLREQDIRLAGEAGLLGMQLMALCVDTATGRVFLGAEEVPASPQDVHVPSDLDDLPLVGKAAFNLGGYGYTSFTEMYTPRQLAVLAGISDEVAKIDQLVLADGGTKEQALAIATVLSLCVGKLAQSNSTLVRWFIDPRNGAPKAVQAFGTQAMPMLWDFAECYPFGRSVGSWRGQIESVIGAIRRLPDRPTPATVVQVDARRGGDAVAAGSALLVTDPPYFGQINYADLGDYFYLWLRRAAGELHRDLFETVATPKSAELVANPGRHDGDKDAARQYFIDGFTEVFASLRRASRPDLPIVVVYAHRQDEKTVDGVISTGWESLLEAVLNADLSVVGTWPIEATHSSRQIGLGANALASYVILICRPREAASKSIDRRGFIARLRAELPQALRDLQQANIAPVDLAQAAIGPGMAVFSRYAQVIEPSGSTMKVRDALVEINRALDEVLWEQEGDFDPDTRFCVRWFTQYGWDEADSGIADNLSRATITSVAGLERGGVFRARARRARLLEPSELSERWDPATDDRISVWEVVLRLVRALSDRGVDEAARLLASASRRIDVDTAKELAYLLFSVSEKRAWTQTAQLFNGLVTSWPELSASARSQNPLTPPPAQGEFDFSNSEE